ncbi:hypothetical protein THIOKS12260008 [Thiocapsa sp. KS1]|nr:hypothetical protein THIOKS12260008 [Thiocapsa sp. KS1]
MLRILALSVANLWRRQAAAPMIHACHLDLRDPRLADELVSRTDSAELMPIVNADIGDLKAEDSNAALADRANAHPDGFPLHEYAWKTVFLHRLAGFGDGLASNVFGIAKQDVLFATAFPGMTPPQVETTLDALRSHAYYLRYSETEGRYYASTGVSINRVLADIRRALRGNTRVTDLLNETSRKVVKAGALNFEILSEVELPECIPDKGAKATLAPIALDSPPVKPEDFIAGSKLRLALPEERHGARLTAPQTDWNRLQGLIAAYRDGNIPVTRAYLQTHAAENAERILDLLEVWAAEARDPDLKKQARAALYGLGR